MRTMLLLLMASGAAPACTVIEGGRILGRDVARANPAYSALPPGTVFGFAPVIGIERVLDAARLGAIARQYQLDVREVAPLCFERRSEVLSEARLRPVLESVLGEGTRVEIVDFSRYPVPAGELNFSVGDLRGPAAGQPEAAVIWRGHVKDAEGTTALVWVKVHVARLERWIETAGAVAVHENLQPSLVVVKSGWRFPFATPPLQDLDQVIGKQAVRSIPAGKMIIPAMLTTPYEVERGDRVDVEVTSGGVILRFSARAETGGRRGDTIVVWSSDASKRWRARVREKGKVRIDADQNKLEMAAAVRHSARLGSAGSSRESQESSGGGAGIALGSISQ